VANEVLGVEVSNSLQDWVSRFSQDVIYLGNTIRFEGIREEEIWKMQLLQAGLWD